MSGYQHTTPIVAEEIKHILKTKVPVNGEFILQTKDVDSSLYPLIRNALLNGDIRKFNLSISNNCQVFFADFFPVIHQTHLVNLNLECCNINDETFGKLLYALKYNSNLKALNVDDNLITTQGLLYLPLLKGLKTLSIQSNNICGKGNLLLMQWAVNESKTVRCLKTGGHWQDGDFFEFTELLAATNLEELDLYESNINQLANSKLKALNFGAMDFRPLDLKDLADNLKDENLKLKELSLACTSELEPQHWNYFLEVLGSTKTLESINLSDCSLDNERAEILYASLLKNKTIKSVNLDDNENILDETTNKIYNLLHNQARGSEEPVVKREKLTQ
jgi:hypothetical protein